MRKTSCNYSQNSFTSSQLPVDFPGLLKKFKLILCIAGRYLSVFNDD